MKKAWVRTGEKLSPKMIGGLAEIDSYRDTAVFAVPTSKFKQARLIQ